MRKLFALLSLLVIASMALAACGGGAAEEAGPNTLRINAGTYPDTIDPQKSSFLIEIGHLNKVYRGLTTLNEKLETVPGAAESWEYNDDATQITFKLKPDSKYSDGSLLNAARFEYSIKRNIDPATAGEYASITDEIVGAAAWRTGSDFDGNPVCANDIAAAELSAKADDLAAKAEEAKAAAEAADATADQKTAAEDAAKAAEAAAAEAAAAPTGCSEEEVAALSDAVAVNAQHADGSDCVVNADTGNAYDDAACDTLVVQMVNPAPYYHTVLSLWVTYPAKQENIEEGGDLWWTSTKFQVGNGPFIWEAAEPFVRSFFTPNPNYPNAPTYNVEYRYITDGAVAFEAYQNNELDIVGYAAEDLPAIEADENLKAQALAYAGSCTTVIKYGLAATYTAPDGSTYESPFKDKKVREAFQYAFDAAGWSENVDQGLSVPTWTWIPPGYPGYKAAEPMFDVEKAKAALAESSYGGPDALNALGLKLTFGDTPRNRTRSEYLVANYKENLGVDIALDPVDPTTFTALTKDPATFPLLARQGWCADYPDPQNWLSVYWKSSTTFAHRQGYKNEEFDALVTEADQTLDPVKRMELYGQAQDLLLADIPSAFGYNTANHFMVKPWVTGYKTTPQDTMYPGDWTPETITVGDVVTETK